MQRLILTYAVYRNHFTFCNLDQLIGSRMRYIVNQYDINNINIFEIDSKINAILDSYAKWIGSLDKRRSSGDDGTLYVGDMGIIFLVLNVQKFVSDRNCLGRFFILLSSYYSTYF